ncbi:Smr/MutS family protein [Paracoccus rhizosphaerae]|uniref:Smr/MutS family protein n=1 Tax=Paracoccus rhizosphaerae TaxID=1133347 RepID=A0ABV6CKL1_9RHOB|nr:Smr/MutS family protein [Paracoccus rhizosphaerae]
MRRRKGLSPEDADLWARVARTAKPLNPRIPADHPQSSPLASTAPVVPAVPAPALPRFRVGQTAAVPAARLPQPQTPAERLAAADLRMDARTHRKMTQGKLRPEARLDLHGMTLAAAQPRLMQFILSCHSNGLRLVLVITGKGRGDHGPLPTRPGALRHQVPHWLHSPPLSAVVQQVGAAHFRHGGEGAYYVYLRRPA